MRHMRMKRILNHQSHTSLKLHSMHISVFALTIWFIHQLSLKIFPPTSHLKLMFFFSKPPQVSFTNPHDPHHDKPPHVPTPGASKVYAKSVTHMDAPRAHAAKPTSPLPAPTSKTSQIWSTLSWVKNIPGGGKETVFFQLLSGLVVSFSPPNPSEKKLEVKLLGNLPQIGMKVKNNWNHHLSYDTVDDSDIRPAPPVM